MTDTIAIRETNIDADSEQQINGKTFRVWIEDADFDPDEYYDVEIIVRKHEKGKTAG